MIGKAYIAELVPQENLGVAYGIYTFFASVIAELLWYHINGQMPFLFAGIISLIASSMFLLI